MVQLGDFENSQEETIVAVRDYCTFLTTMYLPESCIMEPPPGGWPDITAETMKGLDKSDQVAQLLRHLPYMRAINGWTPHGAPWTTFANWQASIRSKVARLGDMEDLRVCSEGDPKYENINSNVIGLTMGGRDNPIFLLDTELGITLWPECPREVSDQAAENLVEDDPFDYTAENEAEWHSGCVSWTIPDFFEVLKDQFRKLHFILMNSTKVKDIYATPDPDKDGMMVMVQVIYREHGWPDLEAYRKEECLQAVHAALKERYPDKDDEDK